MLATRDAHFQAEEDAISGRALSRDMPRVPIERHGYEPSGSGRVFGGIGTIAFCSLIAAGLLVTLDRFDRPTAVSAPLVVSLLPIATVPRPQPKVEKPKPPKETAPGREPPRAEPVARPLVPLPAPPVPAAGPQRPAPDAKPQAEAAPAPPSPAPARPQAQTPASHGPDTWEGRVLARLERFRRYPNEAEHARQQGTAYLRFRIDRDGHVLSSSLERSSGYPALDEAAMETLRRADPLPKIPADRPDQIELLVPIEFFIRR